MGFCHTLAVAPSQRGMIYAAGHVLGAGAVYRSTDFGRTWTRTSGSPTDTVRAIAVHPGSAATVYAATPAGLFRTTNSGANWTNASAGTGFRSVSFYPGAPDTLVAAGAAGAVISRDAGATWTDMNSGLEGTPLTRVEFARRGGDVLIAGSEAAACWLWTLNTGIAGSELPLANGGLRVWPNPCRGRTRVSVSLPRSLGPSTPLSLSLFDISGRLVLRRVIAQPLRHCSLNLASLAAGVYHLEVDNGRARTHTSLAVTGD